MFITQRLPLIHCWLVSILSFKEIIYNIHNIKLEVCVCVLSMLVTKSCPTLFDPMDCKPARLLCPWDFPDKNTGVDCHSLLQGIFPTQRSNSGLLHCRQILYHLSYRENLWIYFKSSFFYVYNEHCRYLSFILWKLLLFSVGSSFFCIYSCNSIIRYLNCPPFPTTGIDCKVFLYIEIFASLWFFLGKFFEIKVLGQEYKFLRLS